MVAVSLLLSASALAFHANAPISPQRTVAPQMSAPAAPKLMAAALAAALSLGSIDAALASGIPSLDTTTMQLAGRGGGRSGGRVGGRVSAPRAMPSSSMRAAPRTNVYVAPPVMGGYGMGYGGYGYGGYGGGGNGLGLYLGLSVAESFMREQQRQVYLQNQLETQRKLGADQAAIQALQMQLQEQNAKVDQLRAQGGGGSTAPQIAPGENEAELRLKLQLLEQQKEIEALKAAAVAK